LNYNFWSLGVTWERSTKVVRWDRQKKNVKEKFLIYLLDHVDVYNHLSFHQSYFCHLLGPIRLLFSKTEKIRWKCYYILKREIKNG
jgi:hypothetical protein